MIVPVRELLLTVLLGLGFTALGDILLRPRARDAFGWNARLLAGAATCAALLFPLSLVFRGRALLVTAILPGSALAVAVGRRIARTAPPVLPRPRGEAPGPASILLLASIAAVVLAFAALNFRYPLWWDGFQIWASKAQRLFYEGGLGRSWYAADVYDRRLLTYPALVPLCEALVSLLRGGFDFDRLKPVFLLFHASLLVSTYAAARTRLSMPRALLATLLVALVPALSDRSAAGGYADMPQAAFVAATVAAAFRDEDARALPFMIGGLTVVKNEGLLLAAIACLAVAASWVLSGSKGLARRALTRWRGVSIVAAFLALRLAYLAWLRIDDPNFREVATGESLREARRRLLHVGRLCAESMLDVSHWGLLWPAAAAAAAYLLWRGDARERCLAASVGLAVAAYGTIFLETNWPLELHVAQALPRLLAQIAPAGILVVLFAAERAGASRPAYDPAEIR